jgi:hypothetical protein
VHAHEDRAVLSFTGLSPHAYGLQISCCLLGSNVLDGGLSGFTSRALRLTKRQSDFLFFGIRCQWDKAHSITEKS